MNIQMKILDDRLLDFGLPEMATQGSAGVDMRAMFEEPTETDKLTILPGETILIPTGISIYIADSGYAVQLLPRSGLGHKHGIVLGNLVGLIDSDYQGPLMVSCWNRSSVSYTMTLGDRIAQMVIIPVVKPDFEIVDEFVNISDRGQGGFGHTGNE